MAILKMKPGALVAFMVLALFAAGSPAAQAATSKLVCNNPGNQGSPLVIDLDEAQHTVTMNDGKNLGPRPAAFDPDKITFSEVIGSGDENTWNYTIDRVTGNISMVNGVGLQFPKLWSCEAGKAKF